MPRWWVGAALPVIVRLPPRLGFCNFISVGVILRKPKFQVLFPTMASKDRIFSSSSKSNDPVSSNNGITKENGGKCLVEDMETVEKMTVAQLKVKLRSFGINPSKGSTKQQLIASLNTVLDHKVNGCVPQDGEILGVADNTSKKKVRRVKKGVTEDTTVDIIVKQAEITENISIESEILKGKKIVKRKISSATVDMVDLSVDQDEAWTIFAHKKPKDGWIVYNPKTMRAPPLSTKHLKLLSWNVNGLRALLNKSKSLWIQQLADREDFDVLCLQETKLQDKDVEAIKDSLHGYENSFWTCSSSKLGYSGTAIISRIKPLSVRYGIGIPDHDTEGRLVTVEFDNLYLLCGYVPNSGDGLRRLTYRVTEWDPCLGNYMKELEKSKPVVLTGDLNCAHDEIDIYNPAGNKRSAGFTDEERQSFETNFLNKGFVDTFRKQHPGVVGYTYWGYRHGGRKTNKGWRLDYFLVSECIADKVHDSYILPDVLGSDHSPIGLILKL